MAAGRKGQPQLQSQSQSQQRSFGEEVIGIASITLAVFLIFSFYSYRSADPQANLAGLVGHLAAESLCPKLGRAAYLIPVAFLYLAGILWHLLRCPAPLSQALAFGVLLFSSSAALALWYDALPVEVAGGWMGGFLALHLREWLNRPGAYLVLAPLLLGSLMGVLRFSLRGTALGVAGVLSAGVRYSRNALAAVLSPVVSLLSRHRTPAPEESPPVKRTSRKDSLSKKIVEPVVPAEDDEEEALPPIIVSWPSPPPLPVTKAKPAPPAKSPIPHGAGNGKPYLLPPVSLLDPPVRLAVKIDEDALHASSRILESKLGDFGVEGKVVAVRPGPVITTYEFEPAPGVKVNRVVSLADDLQMALRAVSVRILAPIPGKAVVGIEVSNPRREKVCLREIIDSSGFQQSESPLTLALGKDSVGNAIVADLARMPHLLVAGATGTGKSVSLNAMIMSLLYRSSPRDVRFIMIDPKMLELSIYEDLPHQLSHVITNPKEAGTALQEIVQRMEQRYKLLRDKGVRNIAAYNRLLDTGQGDTPEVIKLTEVVKEDEEDGESPSAARVVPDGLSFTHQHLPHLVVLIDELADLMFTVGREIEEPITRLAQMGRAAGIHMILATQRPSVDVITGLIKANFPARISFQVSSRIDSRTILDAIGAERLLGEGDMLFLLPGSGKSQRIHGAYVSEPEIRKAVAHIKKQGKPVYDMELVTALEKARTERGTQGNEEDLYDELYEQARDLVMESRQASISWLQRRLRVGYNRAARMIERMEREGLVAPAAEAGKPREVLAGGRRE